MEELARGQLLFILVGGLGGGSLCEVATAGAGGHLGSHPFVFWSCFKDGEIIGQC